MDNSNRKRPERKPSPATSKTRATKRLANSAALEAALKNEQLLLDGLRTQEHEHYLRRKHRRLARKYEQGLPVTLDARKLDVDRLRDLTDFDYRYRVREELSVRPSPLMPPTDNCK